MQFRLIDLKPILGAQFKYFSIDQPFKSLTMRAGKL